MAYHVSLSMFDGPLDLLLHLISRAQVDIRDIFVSEITDQFLEYMAGLDELDMDRASEFLEMAARLLEIKSRRLLPQPPKEEAEEEGEDPEKELIRQLEEYKLFKAAGELLKNKADQAANVFYRLPAENVQGTDFEIENASVQLLMQSFSVLMARLAEDEAERPEQQIERETYTMQQQLFRIQGLLGERRGPVGFRELFSARPGRAEIVTVFIALLELIKLGRIGLKQEALFGGITIEARAKREEDMENGEA